MAIEIRPLVIPATLGTPEAVPFERMAELAIQIEIERWGDDRFAYTAPELLAMYQNTYHPRRVFAAWDDGRCVGRAVASWEDDPGAVTGDVIVEVAAPYRGAKLGSRLLALGEEVIAGLGRRVFNGFIDYPLDVLDLPGPRLTAPQGDAWIPADLAGARFATVHGYSLAQLERQSRLTVAGRLDEFRAALATYDDVASGYRIVGWTDHVPQHLIDNYAAARARMALDVPAGALTIDAEQWDAARVRSHEDQAVESGRTLLVQAAIAPDGTIAGYTELELPPGKAVAYQADTLVVAAHRGRGLGMRMKLANLLRLGETAPDRPDVYTWNADENEHMLAINIALGFEPRGISAEWQRDVDVNG
ncbi:MAG: GNAT family N-acetyltransferase [Actinomycetota bacterium]|nr:GNAT family N-acetyltransferase [Actinomycetota bacterium]